MPAPLMRQTSYCVLLCKYLSTYFFLTHIPTHKCKLNLYLPLPIPFQIIDVLFFTMVRCMPTPLMCQTSYCVLLCKYLSTYFFLTHIPTHKCKLNLYLPLPIPFQIIDVLFFTMVRCMPTPLMCQTSYCVLLCKYLSTYFFLTHIPTHKCKLNLYLPLPIPFQIIDVLFFTMVRHMPAPLMHQTSYCVLLCKYLSTYFFLTHIPTHKCKLNLYLPLPIPFQIIDVLFFTVVRCMPTPLMC